MRVSLRQSIGAPKFGGPWQQEGEESSPGSEVSPGSEASPAGKPRADGMKRAMTVPAGVCSTSEPGATEPAKGSPAAQTGGAVEGSPAARRDRYSFVGKEGDASSLPSEFGAMRADEGRPASEVSAEVVPPAVPPPTALPPPAAEWASPTSEVCALAGAHSSSTSEAKGKDRASKARASKARASTLEQDEIDEEERRHARASWRDEGQRKHSATGPAQGSPAARKDRYSFVGREGDASSSPSKFGATGSQLNLSA